MADRLRAELHAAAQSLLEFFNVRIEYRWWPPAFRLVDDGADERVAAVRRGERRVGRG